MNKDKIIDRIMKVKALAERGTDGERAAAEKLLKELMEKYGITDADIDSEKVTYHLLKTGSEQMFIQLFSQIFHLRFGKHSKFADIRKMPKKDKRIMSDAGFGDKDADVAFECTYAEFIETKAVFDIYKADFIKQLDVFQYAYFDKNDLLLPYDGEKAKSSKDDVEKAMKAAYMSLGIDKKDVHKMIESGCHETNPQ